MHVVECPFSHQVRVVGLQGPQSVLGEHEPQGLQRPHLQHRLLLQYPSSHRQIQLGDSRRTRQAVPQLHFLQEAELSTASGSSAPSEGDSDRSLEADQGGQEEHPDSPALLLPNQELRGGGREWYMGVYSALARGVQVELITSAKRDQPVYKFLKNGLLLRKLIKKGLKVYELH